MATASFYIAVFSLLSFTTNFVLGEEYTVIIATDPPSGPFLVNNEIEFTCLVDPSPPGSVTYSWHAVKEATGATTLRSVSAANTIRYTPAYRDLHISWFFCKVFSNGRQVAVGRERLEIYGSIFTEESLRVHCFDIGNMIRLRVNTSNYWWTSFIRTMNWYHNGTELTNSSRVTILNTGRELIVQNTLSEDAGTYQVQITSLDLSDLYYRDDLCCHFTWFYFLQKHAVYAPVSFTVREMKSSDDNCDQPALQTPLMQYYQPANEDFNTLLTIENSETWENDSTLNYVLSSSIQYYSTARLTVNGTTLSNSEKFNLSQTIMESNTIVKEINYQYNPSDEGFYIPLLSIYNYDIYRALRYNACYCRSYRYFVALHLDISYLSFTTLPFILRTYEPSVVTISSYYDTEREAELIDCSAYGGVPDAHNISIKQEITSSGNSLQIQLNQFGEYSCTVESLYNTNTVFLSIEEKASFQLLLELDNDLNKTQCLEWEENEDVHFLLHEEITNIFEAFCPCVVDVNDISVICSTTGSLLVKGAVIVGSRNITATTLVDMLQVWLITSTDPITMTLEKQTFRLNMHCPVRINSAVPDVCTKLPTKSTICMQRNTEGQGISGAIVGGGFVGGVVVGFLACVIILCVGICILKLKNDMSVKQPAESTDATAKEEEVVMGSNAAYETVELRYQTPSSRQTAQPPAGGSGREEPLYECPAS